MTTVAFAGTPEQAAKLDEIIENHKNLPGALMPVLQEAQSLYGYLPIEVQTIISKNLGVPMAEIYGVVTFYTQFSLEPKGQYNVAVCLGTACYVKGSGKILDAFVQALGVEVGQCSKDGKFSLEATRCIGACGLAPVLTVNDDVYGRLDDTKATDEVKRILAKYNG